MPAKVAGLPTRDSNYVWPDLARAARYGLVAAAVFWCHMADAFTSRQEDLVWLAFWPIVAFCARYYGHRLSAAVQMGQAVTFAQFNMII